MRSWNTHLPETTFFKIAFTFSIAMLIVIAYISFRQLSDVNNAQHSVIRSRERQIETEKLFSLIKDAERMQRGYIISGIPQYFANYQASKTRINESLSRLEKFTNKGSLLLQDLDTLKALTNRRLHLMDNVLEFYKEMPTDTTEMRKELNEGAVAMLKIERFINRKIADENIILNKYQAYYKVKNKSLPVITALLVTFATTIFLISFYRINKEAAKNRKINEELSIINTSFRYAEEIAQIGHWKRIPGEKKIMWSDNLYRMFGLEPSPEPITEDRILEFVHPEDKLKVSETFKKVHTRHIPPHITYRIVLNNGTIKYLKTVGKVVSIGSSTIILGTTCDITSQIDMYASVEQKNKELQAAVEELASFNHIASHDLQEPLRKIQMFISRILTEEAMVLSISGQEYFERISVSALRMEQLIDDLLLYSQTVKEDQVFEQTDLNEMLVEAKLELSAEIENKHAVINSGILPQLFAIPFQIRQLFINLIGNAIKYSKDNVTPMITISSSLIKAKDVFPQNQSLQQDFYKITVSDNGIGFNPEFSEKIFILFQRLHKKENYSGTGIGLAICKKIVENHKGFIIAEGDAGNGASFHIYLPYYTA